MYLFADVTRQIIQHLGAADISSLSESCTFGHKMVREAFTGDVVIRVGPAFRLSESRGEAGTDQPDAGTALEESEALERVGNVHDSNYSRRRMLLSAGENLAKAQELDDCDWSAAEELKKTVTRVDIVFAPDQGTKGGRGVKLDQLRSILYRAENDGLLDKIKYLEIDGSHMNPCGHSGAVS
jgi:hypothetical protein